MADIKLGPVGSEATLPPLSWTVGQPPEIPTANSRAISMVRMSDGSYRVALYKNKRTWTLTWDNLTDAQLAILESVHAYNTALRFQNGWVSAAWYNVVIADYRTNLNADSLHRPVKRYSATIQLREF